MTPRRPAKPATAPAAASARQPKPRAATPAEPTPADRRAAVLRDAANAKHDAAVRRAEAGLRKLIKDGADINFRAVARAGSVSLDFLYAQPQLRARVERLRDQQLSARPAARRAEPDPDEGNVVRTLGAQLRAERAKRQDQVHDLEAKLAAAHGEILRLSRMLDAASPHVTDASSTS